MRPKVILCAVFSLLCSVATAQWLETTLAVGDYPEALCYNSVNNKVYCVSGGGGSDIVTVVDGETNLVLAEIQVSGFEGCGLFYNPTANKVYCSYWNEGYITVICGAGDTVITDISMQVCRGFMCGDPIGNKVYCAGDSGDVTIISGTGDSVLRVLHLGSEAPAASIGHSPDHRKVFCGFDFQTAMDTVFVIDCTMDSVVASVPVFDWPSGQCYNPSNGRIYCRADYDYTITAIDCATNQAVASIYVDYGQSAVCCAPPENKVFCTTYNGRFLVADVVSNTVVDSLETGDFYHLLLYNGLNNKVYAANYDSSVLVVDAHTNQVLKVITVGGGPIAFCHNPRQNRVYVANNNSASVSVLRDSGGGVDETPSAELRTSNAATVVRSVLILPEAVGGELRDIAGRKVLDVEPGANDVSALFPGVYFVRAVSREPSAVGCRKVVIAR